MIEQVGQIQILSIHTDQHQCYATIKDLHTNTIHTVPIYSTKEGESYIIKSGIRYPIKQQYL